MWIRLLFFLLSLCGLYGMVKWGTQKVLGTHPRSRYAKWYFTVLSIGGCVSVRLLLLALLSFFGFSFSRGSLP